MHVSLCVSVLVLAIWQQFISQLLEAILKQKEQVIDFLKNACYFTLRNSWWLFAISLHVETHCIHIVYILTKEYLNRVYMYM